MKIRRSNAPPFDDRSSRSKENGGPAHRRGQVFANMSSLGNLFSDAVVPGDGERFDVLLKHKNLVIERIVSSAHVTPHEYVQAQDEWVVLVRGEAEMRVAGKAVTLKAGDYLFLPAGVPHTVQRTSAGAMWLAVHVFDEQAAVS